MAVTINGNGTITGISVGGLPDGIVDNGTMADDAIAIADLAATGTASATTFLRGDNSWQAAGGGAWEVLGTNVVSTSVSLVSFDGLMTGYQTYRAVISDIQQTASPGSYKARLTASGTQTTASEYSWSTYSKFYNHNASGTVFAYYFGGNAADTEWYFNNGSSPHFISSVVDIMKGDNPATNWNLVHHSIHRDSGVGSTYTTTGSMNYFGTTVHDGIDFYWAGSPQVTTAGRITLYGLKVS